MSMSDSLAAPSPRFVNEELPCPKVSVPLTVMFPLGPEMLELYLSWGHRDVRCRLDAPYSPFRIVCHLAARLSRKCKGHGGVAQIGAGPAIPIIKKIFT